MCLAVPMTLAEKQKDDGAVERDGVRQQVSLLLLPEAEVGDQVLVHAGYAIAVLDAEAAAETERLLAEMAEAGRDDP